MIRPSTPGFGTMELGISPARPSLEDAQGMLVDLVENYGLTFVDTADSYAPSEAEFGYGDVLASAVTKLPGVTVATKGGFMRPDSAWIRNGDPQYIVSAIEASLKRLGVEQIALYQFHTPDPAFAIEDSLAPIVRAQQEGKIANVGVSNFSLDELQRACKLTTITSIQNPLSILSYDPENHGQMLRFCEANDITFLAYAPLGGFRNRGVMETVGEITSLAERAGCSVYAFALMFLNALSPAILPIPGTISREHAIQNLAVGRTPLAKEFFDEVMAIIAAP